MSDITTAKATAVRDFSEDLPTELSEAADDPCHAILEQMLTGLRWLIPADGGTIYLCRGETLRVAVVQNDSLGAYLGKAELLRRLQSLRLAVNSSSIAGCVARTGQAINVPDVDRIPPDSPYTFCPGVDQKTYRYRSLLTAPIINEAGAVGGVVQLINALDDAGQPVPFGVDAEAIVRQFAAEAARVISWWPPEDASTRSPDPRLMSGLR